MRRSDNDESNRGEKKNCHEKEATFRIRTNGSFVKSQSVSLSLGVFCKPGQKACIKAPNRGTFMSDFAGGKGNSCSV